jgi:hypothetical protein
MEEMKNAYRILGEKPEKKCVRRWEGDTEAIIK